MKKESKRTHVDFAAWNEQYETHLWPRFWETHEKSRLSFIMQS